MSRYIGGAVVLGLLFLVLAIQNSERVEVDLLFWHVNSPLYGIALASALLGAAVAELLAGIWRHRRRLHNRERAELDEFRHAKAVIGRDPRDTSMSEPDLERGVPGA